MKKLIIGLIIAIYSLLVSCGSDVEIPEEEIKKEKQITVAFNIKNNATNIATTQKIIITLSEKVFLKNGNALDTSHIEDIISLQLGKTKINYTAEINENGTTITLTANLTYNTEYTLNFNGNNLKGTKAKKVASLTINFTTAKNNAPLSINDPLYKDQWYLKNTGQYGGTSGVDIKIESVWQQGYTGKGISVAVLDEPLGLTEAEVHEDLKGGRNLTKSYNHFPFDRLNTVNHGLEVSGVIAARANNLGIRGIAYESTLYTYGVLGSQFSFQIIVDAMNRINQIPEIAVVNNSWGSEEYITMNGPYRKTLEKGLKTGFNGKGIVHVRAAGNRGYWINATLEGNNNYYGFILVNSINQKGVNTGELMKIMGTKVTHYIAAHTSISSNLWVSAPGHQITSLISTIDPKYTDAFKATSAAAPMVTGVVALVRQANPNLTWRDVKLILAESAVKNDASHIGWKRGYAKKSKTAESFYFNHNYGFGMVNAEKAIALAKTWTTLPTMKTKKFPSATLDLAIDGNAKETTIKVQNSSINFIESVVVELELEKKINILKTKKFDVQLEHNGIVSHLYMEGKSFIFATKLLGKITAFEYYDKNKITLKLLTNAHLGGQAEGTWKIKIKDTDIFTKLKSWKLIIRGH